MFGILSPSKSKFKSHFAEEHRKQYCGLCKTIAVEYSHKARMHLNYDVVFLLSLILPANHESSSNGKRNQLGLSCFSLPKQSELTDQHKFAAAINLFLGSLSVRDKKEDNEGVHWSLLESLYSEDYQKAKIYLGKQGLDVDRISQLLAEQKDHEASFDKDLRSVSYGTQKVTEEIFRFAGQKYTGINPDQLGSIGNDLGAIVFFLDALEDESKDARTNQFNPILTHGDRSAMRNAVLSMVSVHLSSLKATLRALSLELGHKGSYYSRILEDVVGHRLDKVIDKRKWLEKVWDTSKDNLHSWDKLHPDTNQLMRFGAFIMFLLVIPVIGQGKGFDFVELDSSAVGTCSTSGDDCCDKCCNTFCDCGVTCGCCEKDRVNCCSSCGNSGCCCNNCGCDCYKCTPFGCFTVIFVPMATIGGVIWAVVRGPLKDRRKKRQIKKTQNMPLKDETKRSKKDKDDDFV